MDAPSTSALDGRDPQRGPLSEPSRAEIERLRRGDLESEKLVLWHGRTRGLTLAPAPSDQPLLANGTGHLLGVGSPGQRLYGKWIVRLGWVLAPGLLALVFGLDAVGLDPVGLRLAVAGVLGTLLGGAVQKTQRLLERWSPRRRLARAKAVRSLAGLAPGSYVRAIGVVAMQATVPSLFEGKSAVLFRNRVGKADETRGMDFLLDLGNGERVLVRVAGAFLIDDPSWSTVVPICGPVSGHAVTDDAWRILSDLLIDPPAPWLKLDGRRYEVAIEPGAAIEVLGVLELEPSAYGQGGPMRSTPLVPILSGTSDRPLLIARANRATP